MPLVQTDDAEFMGVPPPPSSSEGKFAALELSFTLPQSTYATMCLRELLKSSTRTAQQAALNDLKPGAQSS